MAGVDGIVLLRLPTEGRLPAPRRFGPPVTPPLRAYTDLTEDGRADLLSGRFGNLRTGTRDGFAAPRRRSGYPVVAAARAVNGRLALMRFPPSPSAGGPDVLVAALGGGRPTTVTGYRPGVLSPSVDDGGTAFGDLSGDRVADLATYTDGQGIHVLLGRSGGGPGVTTFVPVPPRNAEASANGTPSSTVAIADLDGDGRSDVVVATEDRRLLLVRRGRPARLSRPLVGPAFRSTVNALLVPVTCSTGTGGCGTEVEPRFETVGGVLPDGGLAAVLGGGEPVGGDREQVVVYSRLGTVKVARPVVPASPADLQALCRPTGRVLTAAPRATVFGPSIGESLKRFVCSPRNGRLTVFERGTVDDSSPEPTSAAAAFGGWAAVVGCVDDGPPCDERVIAVDAASGRVRRFPLAVSTEPELSLVRSVVVGRGGRMGWIVCELPDVPGGGCGSGPIAVRVTAGIFARTLVRGRGIDPRSLRLSASGRSFSWVRHGVRHSAPLR